jgi:3-hydroxybutyryl-CoA dehydrogenase
MKEIRNVTVIGAGTMGHSFAQIFAQAGYQVWLNDVRKEILEKAKRLISANRKTEIELGLLTEKEATESLSRIRLTATMEEACREADFVIEAVLEDEDVKKGVFAALDRLCPEHTILASNTSYLDIYKFVETGRPEKIIIAHWFAPPHIVPLVEVVCGPQTSPETVATVRDLIASVGKRPVVIYKFLPGFIANRLQSALSREVFFLLDNGYASGEDIDLVTKASFGLRIPILGLVKRFDFTGLDLVQKNLHNRQTTPAPDIENSPSVDRLVAQGKLGAKSGSGFYEYGGRSSEEIMKERDIKLYKLREFLQEIGEL